MNIFETISSRGMEALGRYYGNYRAIVSGETDDQGRIPVVIPSISKSQVLAYPKGQDGNIDSGMKWLPPKPGQVVYVEFLSGDFDYPIWSYHGWGKEEIPEVLKGNKAGFRTPNGHQVIIDETGGSIRVSIAKPGKPDEFSTEIIIGEEITLSTETKVNINAEEVIFNEGDTGIPKSDDLVNKLSTLEREINSLRQALLVASPIVMALVPTWTGVQAWATKPSIVVTKLSDIASKKIKQ